jgi:hypothetical protein
MLESLTKTAENEIEKPAAVVVGNLTTLSGMA